LFTTGCRPCTEPGVAEVVPVPKMIEHAEPGVVVGSDSFKEVLGPRGARPRIRAASAGIGPLAEVPIAVARSCRR
jgi:hypothetical protein